MPHRLLIAVFGFAVLAPSAAPQVNGNAAQPQRADFMRRFVAAAIERTLHAVRYDPAYVRIPYPGGDVSADTGVCTDEVIRSYRTVGVDLQKKVHEDMVANYSAYPRKWNWLLRRPDPKHRPSTRA